MECERAVHQIRAPARVEGSIGILLEILRGSMGAPRSLRDHICVLHTHRIGAGSTQSAWSYRYFVRQLPHDRELVTTESTTGVQPQPGDAFPTTGDA